LVASYNLRPGKGVEYSGRRGRDGQKKKIFKANEKRNKGKSKKQQKMRKLMDNGWKWLERGSPAPGGAD